MRVDGATDDADSDGSVLTMHTATLPIYDHHHHHRGDLTAFMTVVKSSVWFTASDL